MADVNIGVKHKFGQKANMPETIQDGTIYFQTDTGNIFADHDGKRVCYGAPQVWKKINKPVTWEEIVNNPNYATDYELGMLQELHIVGPASADIQMELVAFDTDIRADEDTNINNGKARMTWISKDIYSISHSFMNSFVTNWEYSDLRQNLGSLLNYCFPDILKQNILEVKKTTKSWDGSFYSAITFDKIWIPSRNDIFGDNADYENDGVTYANNYPNNSSRIKELKSDASISSWVLRSLNAESVYEKCGVDNSGNLITINTNTTESGVVIGFCL